MSIISLCSEVVVIPEIAQCKCSSSPNWGDIMPVLMYIVFKVLKKIVYCIHWHFSLVKHLRISLELHFKTAADANPAVDEIDDLKTGEVWECCTAKIV
jgi:hypothetical protein